MQHNIQVRPAGPPPGDDDLTPPVISEPWDFQATTQQRVMAAFGNGERIVVSSPTATGKSVMEALVAHECETVGLDDWRIITPREEIARDILKSAATVGIKLDPGKIKTPQKFNNQLKTGQETIPRVLIPDEGHHALAPSWQALYDAETLIAAFTATPVRGLEIEIPEWRSIYDVSYTSITIPHAIRREIIADFYVVKEAIGLLGEKEIGGSRQRQDTETEARVQANYHRIIDLVMSMGAWRPSLWAMPSVETAIEIATHLKQYGLRVEHVTEKVKGKRRAGLLQAIEEGKIDGLTGRDVFLEGMDFKRPSRIVCCRSCVSPIPVMQLYGRGMRLVRDPRTGAIQWEKKKNCEILDLTHNVERFAEEFELLGLRFRDCGKVLAPDLDYEPEDTPMSLVGDYIQFDYRECPSTEPKGTLDGRRTSGEVGLSSISDQWAVHLTDGQALRVTYMLQRGEWVKRTAPLQALNYNLRVGGSTGPVLDLASNMAEGIALVDDGNVTLAHLLFYSLLRQLRGDLLGAKNLAHQCRPSVRSVLRFLKAIPSPGRINT